MKRPWVRADREGRSERGHEKGRTSVLLQGNLKEFSLPNVFQLVKMSAKTGALSITRDDESGKIFFRNGQIHFATAHPGTMPLGERLVKSGHITSKQLQAALAEQKKKSAKGRIGAILLEHGYIDRQTLEQAVRDQIEDVTFNFFSWTDGDFIFEADEDGERRGHPRRDERRVGHHGGLPPHRRVGAHLRHAGLARARAAPALQRHRRRGRWRQAHTGQWRVVCWVDGRHDINTILKECGLDRFNGAKVIYDLNQNGLVEVSDAAIEEIGKGRSIDRAWPDRRLQPGLPQHAVRRQRDRAPAGRAHRRTRGRDPDGRRHTTPQTAQANPIPWSTPRA